MAKHSHLWTYAAILGGGGLLYYFYNKKTATAAEEAKILSVLSTVRNAAQMAPWQAAMSSFTSAEIAALYTMATDYPNTTAQDHANWNFIIAKYGLS